MLIHMKRGYVTAGVGNDTVLRPWQACERSSLRLLVLAGTAFQIPVIRYAKSQGHHVITCDNRPSNHGHQLADEYVNISTTDERGVCELAESCDVAGILAYASDPAAPTAAVVAAQLDLPGNPVGAVLTLGLKSRYRAFLRDHGFAHPPFRVVRELSSSVEMLGPLELPVVVKPTDSSGSRGVTVVTRSSRLQKAVHVARTIGRNGEFIIEELVKRRGPQIGGEAYIYDGRLVMMCLGDQRVNERASFRCVPMGMTFPTRLPPNEQEFLREELQRLITLSGFRTGALNLEIMKDADGRLYFMEVAPRSGGNLLPELMRYTCGFEVARYSVDHAMGLPAVPPEVFGTKEGHYAYFAIHAKKAGLFNGLRKSDWVSERILQEHLIIQPGAPYCRFEHSGSALGIWLMRFQRPEEADIFFDNPYRHYELIDQPQPASVPV